MQPKARAHRLFDAKLIDHRQHARHGRINERHMRIGLRPNPGRSPRKQLGMRGDLGMDFHPDHQFPVMFGTRNYFRFWGCIGQIKHGKSFEFLSLIRQSHVTGQEPAGKNAPNSQGIAPKSTIEPTLPKSKRKPTLIFEKDLPAPCV